MARGAVGVGCVLVLALTVPVQGEAGDSGEGVVTLAAVGDVLLARGVAEALAQGEIHELTRDARAALSAADLTFCNLECPVTAEGLNVPKPFSFRADPKSLNVLKAAGFGLVSLANNHSLDCAKFGLVDTMDALRAAGMEFVGAGMNRNDTHAPLVVEANGMRLAFLAYSDFPPEGVVLLPDRPCVAMASGEAVSADVAGATEEADVVVVSFHGGTEYADHANGRQRDFFHAALSAGADVILGHHPHVLQGMEWRRNGAGRQALVAQSLGNFIFDYHRRRADETGVLHLTVGADGVREARITPMVVEGCFPRLASERRAETIVDRLRRLSPTSAFTQHDGGDGSTSYVVSQSRQVTPVRQGQDLVLTANAAERGSVLTVEPGVYPGGVLTADGVTIRREGPGEVVISSRLDLRADDVTLEGMTWQDMDSQLVCVYGRRNAIRQCQFRRFGKHAASKAVWIREDGDHGDNVIENCLFEDWGGTSYHSSCIKIGQSGHGDAFTGTVVRNCTFRGGAVGGNSPAIQPFCPSLIEGNTIHDCEDGIEVKGSHMVIRNNTVYRCSGGEAMSNRSGSDNLFEGNLLYDIPTYAWQIWTGHRNVFRNNVVHHCGRIAHIKGGNTPEGRAADVLLINNTFVGCDRGISWDLKAHPPESIRFVNNIFVGDGSSSIESVGKGCYTEDHNLFFQFAPPAAMGSHSVAGQDPLFLDADRHDYRLTRDSPARDAGLSSGAEMPQADRAGVTRPQGDRVDIGAFEHAQGQR